MNRPPRPPRPPRLSAPAAAALLAAAAAAACTGGAWYGVVAPARASAAAAAEGEARLAAAEREEAAADAGLAAARGRERALRAEVEAGVRPGSLERRNERLAGLLTLAEAAGLEVLRLDPSDPVPAGGHAEVHVDVEARGPYAAHRLFLGRLAEGPEDLSVRGFRLSGTPPAPAAGAAGGGDAVLGGRISLRWVVAAGGAAVEAGGRP